MSSRNPLQPQAFHDFYFFFNSKNQTGGMEKHSWGLLLVWEPELPLPRNYQELLFLLILALLTA